MREKKEEAVEANEGGTGSVEPQASPGATPIIVEMREGEWVERLPPGLEPQFRCLLHGRRSVIWPDRWTSRRSTPTDSA